MTEPETILFIVGLLMVVTFGVLRVAFCRVARHTAHLLERGWRDVWL